MNERLEILNEALSLTQGDRNKTYGSFVENMQCFAELMEWWDKWAKDKHTGAHNAAMRLAFTKISRMAVGAFHRDNYTDCVNYIAAAYECELNAKAETKSLTACDTAAPSKCPFCFTEGHIFIRKDYVDAFSCAWCGITFWRNSGGEWMEIKSAEWPKNIPASGPIKFDPVEVFGGPVSEKYETLGDALIKKCNDNCDGLGDLSPGAVNFHTQKCIENMKKKNVL